MSEASGSMGDPNTSEIATASDSPPAEPVVERIAGGLQNGIKALIGANRKPPRLFKSLLHGSFLGHPLHPVMTDIPITAWLIAVLFDILWLVNGGAFAWAARGAQAAVLIGIAGALGSIVTGMADWSDTFGHERRVGLLHGLLNTGATLLFIVSALLRYGLFAGHLDLSLGAAENSAAAILGFLGLACVLYAAFLGGDLVFANATGVNHTHFEPHVEQFERVGALADMPANGMRKVIAAGAPVLLVRLGERIYAISSTCSHDGGPLDEGELQKDGQVVQCPWHSSRFDVRTGHVLTGPATVAAPRYETRIVDGQIEVKRQ